MASIGTVLTPQMKEQTIYVSDDGQRFDTAEDCQLWERMRVKWEQIDPLTFTDEEVPEEAERFLDYPLSDEDFSMTPRKAFADEGRSFVEAAKALKALNDWLWS